MYLPAYINGYFNFKNLCCKIILLILKKFKKTVRLGWRFHSPVLDNTIKLRTTPGTQKQKGKKRDPI